MSTHCRHEGRNQPASYDEIKTKSDGYTHIIDSYFAPEKHFEPWNLSDSSKNRKCFSNSKILNEASFTEPSNPPCFSRHYGWDEIEQNEEEAERLRQLLPIWDAERIAILKLQHDLDKNIFKRTFDYVKRIGQSIGLALWLWVHRPANCSNISNLYQYQQLPVTNDHQPHHFNGSPCLDTLSYPLLEKNDNQECSIPSIDTLPDSLWLKRFVLDEPQEYLPPIARAMKNMLDNDMIICNSENQEQTLWPHFINQRRTTQNKTFLRNLQGNNVQQLPFSKKLPPSSNYATDKRKSDVKVAEISKRRKTKIDRPAPKKIETSIQPKKVISVTNLPKISLKQQQNMINISQLIDNQSLLKPPELSLKKGENSSPKQEQKSNEKDQSKSEHKKANVDEAHTQSKSKSQKSRKPSKPEHRSSRSQSKSKRKKSRGRSKSKAQSSSSRSKSKGHTSAHRSKAKNSKSRNKSKSKPSRRSKSKKKRKHITARTIK